MNGSDLLDIPLLGEMLAMEVKHFAQGHDLSHWSWYHGEPRWIVGDWLKREDGVFRKVQIVVCHTGQGENIHLMPQGLKWENRWSQTRPDTSIMYPLSALLPVDESTRKKLQTLIAYAWLVAETLQEGDLSPT